MKKREKFELDYANWTTYVNFKMIYDNIGAQIVERNIIKELDEPVWIDIYSNICKEKNAAGFKVSYNMIYPNYFLVANNLEENIS